MYKLRKILMTMYLLCVYGVIIAEAERLFFTDTDENYLVEYYVSED